MTPHLLLAVMLILLSAFYYHALFGQTIMGLLSYVLASLFGFLVGELVSRLIAFDLLLTGPVHVAGAMVGAWLAMMFASRRVR